MRFIYRKNKNDVLFAELQKTPWMYDGAPQNPWMYDGAPRGCTTELHVDVRRSSTKLNGCTTELHVDVRRSSTKLPGCTTELHKIPG
jgi:hypothetical protein